jgi:GAF domain-containing protein
MNSGNPAARQDGSRPEAVLSAPARLEALRKTGLLASNPDERFDRLTRLAAHALQTPVALVSLVTQDEQLFKSCFGLDGPLAIQRRTPLSHSFCKHAVISGEPLIISDARIHPLVSDNPAVHALGVIAYAGIPMVVESGEVIGSFCIIDNKPREWTETEISMLRDLAASAMTEINLQSAKERAEAANRAKDRFLAILSHELRMPLSPSLMTVAAMADDADLPQSVREDAAMVQRNIQQQARLIDDLLDITRIENGKLALRVEPIDLHEVLEQSFAECGAEIDASGVEVKFDLHASRPTISGDML